MEPELLERKRDEILRIATKYVAHNFRAFGSCARGNEDERRDIDLLVDLEPGGSLLDLGELQYEPERLLGGRVDVATEHGLKRRVREPVMREPVPL